MNEIEHVKKKLLALKEQNPKGLQNAVLQLQSKRKDYLNNMMSAAKVHN